MKTWVFEIIGNHASVYIVSGLTGAAILYRQIRYRCSTATGFTEQHHNFLKYISREIAIAEAPGTNARCRIRGTQSDIKRIQELLIKSS